MKIVSLVVFFLILISTTSYSQTSNSVRPASWFLNKINNANLAILPSISQFTPDQMKMMIESIERHYQILKGSDGNIGNGGGGWVCRNLNGSVRWVTLIDLFEAEAQYNYKVIESSLSVADQVDLAVARLTSFNEALGDQLRKSIQIVNSRWPEQGYGDLMIVHDADYLKVPEQTSCPEGLINYEQIVNYTNDEQILVNDQHYQFLSNTEKAALIVHEALYLMSRTIWGDRKSVETRKLVAIIFSQLSSKDFLDKIAQVLIKGALSTTNFIKVDVDPKVVDRIKGMLQYNALSLYNWKGKIGTTYEIGQTEVTQLQWVSVMKSNPSYFSQQQHCPKTFMTLDGVALCPTLPVEKVYLKEVQSFIAKLNSTETKVVYTLPTVVEWLYAFLNTDDLNINYLFPKDLESVSWLDDTSTYPVGLKLPNTKGTFDMLGNVSEWTNDSTYSSNNYIMGGSFVSSSSNYFSLASLISYQYDSSGSYTTGFRLVRKIKLQPIK